MLRYGRYVGGPNMVTRSGARVGFQFGIGIALLVVGVGQSTDTIAYDLPAIVYILLGIGLGGYGVVLVQRS
ncbi:hypothetical protein SAMN04489841_3153 [Natrinema salaciae]|uniref:Uncharacterized protein n=1 Tax=Natrinema salaciae TaxID=1186196 RepID=A0A1H9M024_9EURY|nr:hypothetical protein SAMN04489841_3153 [Natrinema salaciae]